MYTKQASVSLVNIAKFAHINV